MLTTVMPPEEETVHLIAYMQYISAAMETNNCSVISGSAP